MKSIAQKKFDEEMAYFDKMKKAERTYLDESKPCVFFFDGKDVTKDKEKYDLFDCSFQMDLMNAVRAAFDGIECDIYVGMDEASIVVKNTKKLLSSFRHKHTDYVGTMFLQSVLSEFWKKRYGQFFKKELFSLGSEDDCERYLAFRKDCIQRTSMDWFFKMYIPEDYSYRDRDYGALSYRLYELGKDKMYYSNDAFRNGILLRNHTAPSGK